MFIIKLQSPSWPEGPETIKICDTTDEAIAFINKEKQYYPEDTKFIVEAVL